MGGIELIAEARGLQPALEAMMITGYASSESVIAAFAAGASDYILKPFDDLRVLRAKVRAALERRAERHRAASRPGTWRGRPRAAGRGQDAPEPARQALEDELRNYEQAVKDGGTGRWPWWAARTRCRACAGGPGGPAGGGGSPLLRLRRGHARDGRAADGGCWRRSSRTAAADVLLLADPQADLSDLLEAIGLRLDLVGFGARRRWYALPERVRMLLMRRAIERAQAELAARCGSSARSSRTGSSRRRRSWEPRSEAPALLVKSGRLE